MNREQLIMRMQELIAQGVPLPGCGHTVERHRVLFEVGREDLSLARLAEAHWDAVAILAEAGRKAEPGVIYGVWAAEIPGKGLRLTDTESTGHKRRLEIRGTKPFCSGAGIVQRALVTVKEPHAVLVDVDLRGRGAELRLDESAWKTGAFAETKTATAEFDGVVVSHRVVGGSGFYLDRPGFWHGACGPAACWAGGAAGLVDWASQQKRDDAHTLAHLGAMKADVWSMKAALRVSGEEIDSAWNEDGQARALTVRHVVEQGCTDVLRRVGRAYGPHPLAMDAEISRRYQELDLYVRQCHAERDLEALGRAHRISLLPRK